jgi:release factor glutamine methyltransferase
MTDAEAAREATPVWTVGALLAWTTERFERAGLDEARLDAQHLLAFAMGCKRMDLFLRHGEEVDDTARERFRGFVKRRLAREPVAYIEARRGFHGLGLDLHVDRRVLVPRPETELLVDAVLDAMGPPPHAAIEVLDVGTGSGAIALAILHARPFVRVVACDVSEDALSVARLNAARLGLQPTFVRSDLTRDVPVPQGGYDVVAANLPYIARPDLAALAPEVRDHEPTLALDGGEDGLDLVRRLLDELDRPGLLAARARVFLEIGAGQAQATAERLSAHGFETSVQRDLAGIERIVSGIRGHG